MPTLQLSSSAFDDGDPIPERFGYTEENVSPPLSVSGVPEDATSLALVMDDPDAKPVAGKIWTHWVVWNIPADVTTISEGDLPAEATEGRNDWDEAGYGGPNPPDGEHTYRFVLYALDATLDLPATSTQDDLEAAIEGHVLAESRLEGTYEP